MDGTNLRQAARAALRALQAIQEHNDHGPIAIVMTPDGPVPVAAAVSSLEQALRPEQLPKTAPFPHAWQCRVVDEKADNDERMHKLQQFLGDSSLTLKVDVHDLQLLLEQEHLMRRLSAVLGERIRRFGRTAAPSTSTERVQIRGAVCVDPTYTYIHCEDDVIKALKVAGAADVRLHYNPRDFGWLVSCTGPANFNPTMPQGVTWRAA